MQSCSICKGLLGAYYGYKTVQNIYYVTKEYVKHSFLFGFIKIYDTYKEKTVKNQEVKCCHHCATHNFSHPEVIAEVKDWNDGTKANRSREYDYQFYSSNRLDD
tara:strand:- start:346 stop:657 length:312 start_codon:yes stop_codon:yes gene_type:complete